MFDPNETLTLAQIRALCDYLEPDTLAEMVVGLRAAGIRSMVTVAELADEALVANVGGGNADMLRHFAGRKENAASWLHSIVEETGGTNPPKAILRSYIEQGIAARAGGFVSDETLIAAFRRLTLGDHADLRRWMLAALPSLAAEFHEVLFEEGDGLVDVDAPPMEAPIVGSCVYCEKPIWVGEPRWEDEPPPADGENGPSAADAPIMAHRGCHDDSIETERKLREEERSRGA